MRCLYTGLAVCAMKASGMMLKEDGDDVCVKKDSDSHGKFEKKKKDQTDCALTLTEWDSDGKTCYCKELNCDPTTADAKLCAEPSSKDAAKCDGDDASSDKKSKCLMRPRKDFLPSGSSSSR